MRVLFIHHHFPGPFRHLAATLGAMPDTTVLFLSERGRKDQRLPGVRRLRVTAPAPVDARDDAEREIVTCLRRGASTANILLGLRKSGFVPDIVYGDAGDGSGFYVRDIFPEAAIVMRSEWFYTQGENHTFFNKGKPRPAVDFAPARARNLCQFNALYDCDLAITASEWQRAQYPEPLARKMVVVRDGVNPAFFSPVPGARFVVPGCDLSGAAELVTFSCRQISPARGCPQFFSSLPRLLTHRPACHVVIMTTEVRPDAPSSLNSNALQDLHLSPEQASRVHLLESRPLAEYRLLLRASTAHVYLTAPFTLSAGLFEAMSCGGLVIGSDTAPVREVLHHGENGFLCDFWAPDTLADVVAGVVERAPQLTSIRTAARQTVLRDHDLRGNVQEHLRVLNEVCAKKES